ncbi:MAG: FHA domain-containing protein [Myxococcota bacterium]
MRECLGWITNCPNDAGCPQNWLELAVSETPTAIGCHVCGRKVELVLDAAELDSHPLAAFPVVPCAGRAVAEPAPLMPAAPEVELELDVAPAAPARHWVVGLQNGEIVQIDKDTMIIGRSRTCDVVIPSAKVSRQHASLSKVQGELFIEDLGSANGVWLNGEKITRAKVSPGDTFTISDETLRFDES